MKIFAIDFLVSALVLLIVGYGCTAFVIAEPNPFEWREGERFFLVFVTFIVGAPVWSWLRCVQREEYL